MIRIPTIVETRVPVPGRAVALWPLLIVSDSATPLEVRLGALRVRQQGELLVVLYFLLFTLFWVMRLLQIGSPALAYRSVPFVREVDQNRHDPTYLALRERNAWWQYVRLERL